MSDQSIQPDVTGSTDHPQHRAPEGEGWRAPRNDEGGGDGVAQHSIYDGAGNEIVVANTTGPDGRPMQGTGPTAADAIDDAKNAKGPIGEGFGPGGGQGGGH
ncbi:MAG: hypothetical protein ACLGI2_05785 [Acidimicrobiia bacterium]